MKCNVCGKKFKLKKENKYIVEKLTVFNKYKYEAFDCHYCGCQNIVNERFVEIKNDEDNSIGYLEKESEVMNDE